MEGQVPEKQVPSRVPAGSAAAVAAQRPKEPVLIFAPYLPLRQALIAGQWWIGPLQGFTGKWRDARFKELAEKFITSFQDARGQPIANPALITHKDRGADGLWPGADEFANLQLALDFAVLDANRPWTSESNSDGWFTSTSDNARLFAWPVDIQSGGITLHDGVMVEMMVGGVHIDDHLAMRAPVELHVPNGVTVAPDLVEALLAVFGGQCTASDATLAKRLATAVTWLGQAWRNTESIRWVERIVMLKTAFEALTDASDRTAAKRLEQLFDDLRKDDLSDYVAGDLLWRPSESATLERTWRDSRGRERSEKVTPLSHWFHAFEDVRNEIIHEGKTGDLIYNGPAERYQGPYVFIGERLLRESVRVSLRQFGYADLWQSYAVRLTKKDLAPVIDRLLNDLRRA